MQSSFNLFILPFKKFFFNHNRKPISLTLAVTYRCQSKCKTCHIWKINLARPGLARLELKFNDYTRLFESLSDSLIHLTITGGEPFLKNDLDQLIKLSSQKLKRLTFISLTTNGFLSEKILTFTKNCLKIYPGQLSIEISLDGEKNVHDRIRGLTGSFNQALTTFKALNDLVTKNSRLQIFFSYTISHYNVGLFKLFFQKLQKELAVNLSQISINLEHSGLLYQKDNPIYWQDNLEKLTADVDFILKESHLKPHENLFKIGKTLFQRFYLKNLLPYAKNPKKMILPCAASSSSFFIDPYGDIYPCISWEEKLGNIKKIDLDHFFQSGKLAKIQKKIKQKSCPLCFTPCQLQTSYLLNWPWLILKS